MTRYLIPHAPPPEERDNIAPFTDPDSWSPWPGTVAKHMGPGPHPGTGTEQTIHGHGDGTGESIHGAALTHPTTGEGTSVKSPTGTIKKTLVTEDGTPWTHSASYEGEVFLVNHFTGKTTNVTAKYKTVIETMYATAEKYKVDMSEATLDANLDRLLESAYARYSAPVDIFDADGKLIAGPSLVDHDRFYEMWHESLFELSRETEISIDRQIAGASVISPGLNAERNLHFIHDLSRWVAKEDEIRWEGQSADDLATYLEERSFDILNPKYDKKFHKIPKGKKHGDFRPPPEEGSPRWIEGDTLRQTAAQIRSSGSMSLAEMPSYSAAYALHSYRKSVGPAGELLGRVRDLYVPPPGLGINGEMSGFDVSKGYDNYGKAIAVLRGEMEPIQVLGDIKTRSFFNNILDPFNEAGRNDVTVDYHSINYASFSFGADANTSLQGTPAFEGVSLGVRPLVADAIRRAADRWGDKFPEGNVGSRIQEITWAEWRRGQDGKNQTWTSYADDKLYDNLPYTGTGKFRQAEQEAMEEQ